MDNLTPVILLLVLLTLFSIVNCFSWDIQGDYCRTRRPRDCCTGRDDSCTVPILGTLCYCDLFCNRTSVADCCPDYFSHCLGQPRPEPILRPECLRGGQRYYIGQGFKTNCNQCTCKQKSPGVFDFDCEDNACLVRPEVIDAVNRGNYGWRASNYSFLWGKTLEDGIKYRLGTYKPSEPTMEMNEIRLDTKNRFPESFDARQQWPGLVHSVVDQGDCGSSWAISTISVATDRLAIHTLGTDRIRLSAQQLISCQNKGQKGCEGGHLDRAWWYLRKHGVPSEDCYPYSSGHSSDSGSCRTRRIGHRHRSARDQQISCPNGRTDVLYHSTPPYRIGNQEELIMQELLTNGPVQAAFLVHEDFFLYRNGVYSHSRRLSESFPHKYRRHGWHSVRIIGWGVDRSNGRPIKYWLCANSWGRLWGEDGMFRIVRGDNECDIESFIIGVWAKHEDMESNVISNHFERHYRRS